MKRTFAVVALLAALGILSKLAFKPGAPAGAPGRSQGVAPGSIEVSGTKSEDPEALLMARHRDASPADRELVARVADRFRQNAVAIDRTDGIRGLRLLDRLDLEAVFLYEKHPREFRSLREMLTDEAAADVLLHWREYFGLKRADETDRGILVAELSKLSPVERRLAARFPNALPLILADPAGMAEAIESLKGDDAMIADALVILSLISLEHGASDLRVALRTLENHGPLALEAFRRHGLEGFGLVSLYGTVLEPLGPSLPLEQALILLRVNSDYVDELLKTHRPESVAGHLRHVAAAGLTRVVGGSPNALRLVVEYGQRGELALLKAGPDAADVVYGDFNDPTLRNQAVAALGEHGTMALAMLDKYASDPDFREILRRHGGSIIPPIARADAGPETLALLQSKPQRTFTESLAKSVLSLSGDNGQVVVRMIRDDGLERVAALDSTDLRFYQFLPLYDLLHLGNVVRQGHAPTSGEMTWALLDGCFVVADALSLAAIQPEGAVAAEVVRSEVKAAAREGARSIGRQIAESGGESAGKSLTRTEVVQVGRGAGLAAAGSTDAAARRIARWWAVRSAGGMYQVLERLPEALPRLSLAQISEMARPICTKAGMRLAEWKPVRLLRAGVEVIFQIPPQRGLKYVGAQLAQASVGVIGFQKMEEHLASRRPQQP